MTAVETLARSGTVMAKVTGAALIAGLLAAGA